MPERARLVQSRPAPPRAVRARGATRPARAAEREYAAAPLRRLLTARVLQPQLLVGAVDDPLEREAERTATAVTSETGSFVPSSGVRPPAALDSPVALRAVGKAEPAVNKDDDDKPKQLQKAASGAVGPTIVPPRIEDAIQRLKTGGDPLPDSLRASFEPRFGHDFRDVRVHAGRAAAGAAVALGARAFTVGKHIFFGEGEYRPSSPAGRKLIAHELTHTIQQQPSSARTARIRTAPVRVQRLFDDTKDAILARVKEFAQNEFPPWELLTLLLGRDPITDKTVERSARNWLHAVLKLVPDGMAIFDDLEKNKTIEKVAAWFDAQIAKLDLTWEKVKALFSQAWDALDLLDLARPTKAWNKVKGVFGPTVKRLWEFISTVGGKILDFIKTAVLGKIAAWAKEKPGYTLLTVILGKDPITDEEVKRTPKGFVFAVLDLVPGGDKIKENLEKSKAIEKTVAWLDQQITTLDLTWTKIKELFARAWAAFKVVDLLTPKILLEKMAEIFGPPLGRLLKFVVAVGKKVLEFIFEGAMLIAGPIGQQIVRIVRKAGDTFNKIVEDPIGFVGNLVKAVKLGFQQFGKNIWEHLKTGLIEWLVGTLEGAGLVLPKVWDLKGILDLVLQILGISYAKIRVKLVKVIGEERVAMLERVFDFIKALVTQGPVAAWQKIVEAIGSLWDLVIGGIKDWAVTKIVTAAITKLATMFNPAGAIIQAIIAIYNTVAFFVERIKQILALVEAIVDSIANIAAGKLTQAANFVERAMARTIPVILGFLSRLIGLGDPSGAIKKVIVAIQDKVDKAVDAVIAWIVEKAKALFGKQGDKDQPPDEKWTAAATGVNAEIDQLTASGTDPEAIQKAVPGWRQKYGLKTLTVSSSGDELDVTGEMSPAKRIRELPIGIHYDHQLEGGKAKRMHAVPIRQTTYSAPYEDPVGWGRLNHNYWVRGHLLHGRSSGPGALWNLTPIPKSTNSAMYSGHEEKLHGVDLAKTTANPLPLFWYRAEVTYYSPGDPKLKEKIPTPADFPKTIAVRYGRAKLKGAGYDEQAATVTKTYDVDAPTTAERDLGPR